MKLGEVKDYKSNTNSLACWNGSGEDLESNFEYHG